MRTRVRTGAGVVVVMGTLVRVETSGSLTTVTMVSCGESIGAGVGAAVASSTAVGGSTAELGVGEGLAWSRSGEAEGGAASAGGAAQQSGITDCAGGRGHERCRQDLRRGGKRGRYRTGRRLDWRCELPLTVGSHLGKCTDLQLSAANPCSAAKEERKNTNYCQRGCTDLAVLPSKPCPDQSRNDWCCAGAD